MTRSRVPLATTILVLAFFYLPVVFLVVNSFNASRFGATWEGFSLGWYEALFANRAVWEALRKSMAIAVVASLASMVLGTLAACALHWFRRTRLQKAHYGLVYLPLVAPDILMGISLLAFFVALGLGLGMQTIMLAHVTFCISYVALVVLGRLQDFDPSLLDAARDLGADRWRTIRHVVVPLLAPGILAGGLLAFTLSIDDFVITFFVSGPGTTTLPLWIYSMIRHSRQMPIINALSALLLLFTFVSVWLSQRASRPSKAA